MCHYPRKLKGNIKFSYDTQIEYQNAILHNILSIPYFCITYGANHDFKILLKLYGFDLDHMFANYGNAVASEETKSKSTQIQHRNRYKLVDKKPGRKASMLEFQLKVLF